MEYVLAIRRHNQVRGYSFFDASSFLPLLPRPPPICQPFFFSAPYLGNLYVTLHPEIDLRDRRSVDFTEY